MLISCNPSDNNMNEKDKIVITDAWMRAGLKDRNTAAFLKITNNSNSDDTLFSVSSNLAKETQIHETFTKENDIKGMRHIEKLIIPANSSVELKPGEFHVMLIGLNKDLTKGETGNLNLQFKNYGSISIKAEVK